MWRFDERGKEKYEKKTDRKTLQICQRLYQMDVLRYVKKKTKDSNNLWCSLC